MLGFQRPCRLGGPLPKRGRLGGGEARKPTDMPPRLDNEMTEIDLPTGPRRIGKDVREDHELVTTDHTIARPMLVTHKTSHARTLPTQTWANTPI